MALAGAGHRLALVDRDADALGEAVEAVRRAGGAGGAPLAVTADVTDPGEVRDACARVERDRGPVDVLVSAAGVYGERVGFLAADPDLWWDVLRANVRGPALCARQVLPQMVARGRGHVVNINSRAATWDDPGQSSVAYSTSKAALARFTSALAAELTGTGVVVLDLSPGMVRTRMTAGRADLAALPDAAYVPLSAVGEKVVALVSGRYDALHGRFVHATDDLDVLVRRLDGAPQARSLALVPYGDDDPLA
jgi:NAD(P)-dependent dehydrogenase (short-subunit alcohol dehydrogenase family)